MKIKYKLIKNKKALAYARAFFVYKLTIIQENRMIHVVRIEEIKIHLFRKVKIIRLIITSLA